MSAQIEQSKRYLNPAAFRKITGDGLGRAADRLLPKVAKVLGVTGKPQLDQLRHVLLRDVLPDTIQEIMNLANEINNGDSLQ